jgi:hypothetical protein
MFDFLRKKDKVEVPSNTNVVVAEKEAEKEVSIDEQIYKDVYSAQELLLEEAKSVLENCVNLNDEKYVTLKKMHDLGFANAEAVKEFMEYEAKIKYQNELKEIISYYQRTYPLNKFIDNKTVKIICDKYGLVLADVRYYNAEIPEKNQKEIVSFKIRNGDVRIPHEVGNGMMSFIRMARMEQRILRRKGDNRTLKEIQDDLDAEKVNGKHLLIIAPQHKFIQTGLEKDGHTLKIKDPIVLQPVGYGYLIVSSWGLEAGDELVVNAINN